MPSSRETLKKRDILRGHTLYRRLLQEGQRVRGRGVTLFFCRPLPSRVGSA